MKKFILILLSSISISYSQYEESYITRTTSTNSVFPRQFPSMTIRKMNDKEYWIFESLSTNTIFHRQFPTYIIRKQNLNNEQAWGVYRTTSTNSVFPNQFPDRYIADLPTKKILTKENIYNNIKNVNIELNNSSTVNSSAILTNNSYTYSKSLRKDNKPSYNPEVPE